MKVKLQRLHPDAQIPRYATEGAGCFDLHSVDHDPKTVSVNAQFRTGLAVEVPQDHVMLIFSRSGHGFGKDTRLANCVGVIDADYRGEIAVKLTRDDACKDALLVNPGDRIAQALILPVQQVEFVEVESLSDTARGAGGFGSTGQS